MIKPFTIQLSVLLMDRVKNVKSRTGRSIQSIITQAITEYLNKNCY